MIHWRREWQTTPVFLPREPHNSMKKQKDMTPENEPPSSEGVRYATGEEQRAITDSSRKNEVAAPKWKQRSVVDVSGGESKVQCCKEQYCIGTQNVRSISLVQFSCSVMSNSLRPHGLQHARLPCPPPTPGAYSSSCPLSR